MCIRDSPCWDPVSEDAYRICELDSVFAQEHTAATLWCVKLGGSWVDRCEPGQRFKRAKSSSIKSIGPLQCGGQPSNAASSAQAFETARLVPRPRRRRREHRLVQIERDKVESLTARPGGGDSSSKTSSDVRGHRIPRDSTIASSFFGPTRWLTTQLLLGRARLS